MTGILSLITFGPLLGVAALLILQQVAKPGEATDTLAKWIALVTTLAVFALSLVMLAAFDRAVPGFQFHENVAWFAGLRYQMGVDGISVLLVILTTFLLPICIVASWRSVEKRLIEYLIAFLVLEVLVVGVFCALDLVLFYLFFEGGLVPMFLIIGIWGGKRRVYAAYKFFLYTLLGSVLMLAAVLAMINVAGTSSIPALMAYKFAPWQQTWLWLAFFASFAVKMPMWPVHTWLPDAHVEAPTAGSVILAGILKLIAYSSVAHMGFVTMGIFSGNVQGEQGALYQMLSHGLISGALFLCVGVVYDRMHTREIAFYGGLVTKMPLYAAVFMLFTMGNVGLPGTSGFVGEILTMTGTYQASTWTALGAATGVILSAVYALTLYRRVIFGQLTNPALAGITDLDKREILLFVPLVIGTLILGVYPALIFDVTAASVENLVTAFRAATGG
jgi:NADH-quinone oxidoreductase subunit M